MPYLKLISSDHNIYLKLAQHEADEEWIESIIEVRLRGDDCLIKSLKPTWYYEEPRMLLSTIENSICNVRKANYSLLDDPTIEFVFDSYSNIMLLRIYSSFELKDHLLFCMDLNQLDHLRKYLELFTGKANKKSEEIKKLYDQGIFQGS